MSDTKKIPAVPSVETDADLTDRRLGDFHLLRRLGRGGMGDVYLAEQDSLKRQVAIKVLRPSLSGDSSYVQRFTQEARAAAKLVHANIVQIYEVGVREGMHYIAQEYVPGGNLRQLIARSGKPLDANLVIPVMRQVLSALHKAGELGIVHRDIKPENIMLTPAGEVKVADFGLARITGDGDALHLTQMGMTMGSPLYMSPEQAEGKPVDPRSDLYSFGATVFHMLTGRPPFEGATPLAVAVQHVKSPPPNLAELRPDLSPNLCALVHKLLSKKPAERFNHAADVLKSLHALRGEGLSESQISGLAGWSDAEAIALGSARFSATQKLDQIMRTQSMRTPRKLSWWQIGGIVFAAFLLGCILAGLSRPKPLLPPLEKNVPSNKS
jgi:eukaryotic-like serine/threonine-protein kinase